MTKKLLESAVQNLISSQGCSGGCTYWWDGSNYVYKSGACTGGASCAGCPGSYPSEVHDLVKKLPGLFPDPDAVTFNCGLSIVGVPLANLLVDIGQNDCKPTLGTARSTFYRDLAVALGVASFLLSLSLLYMVFLR